MNLNIRARLTLQFTFIVIFILLLFSFSIYYFSASYRESEFYSRLETKALTTARLLLQVKEVDHDLLKIIDRNSINALYNEKVQIYDYKNELIYNSLDDDSVPVSLNLLNKIRLEKELRYHEGDHEVIGLLYTDKYDRFAVVASALDKYGRSKLNFLKWILILVFFSSIGLTIFLGKLYATRALKPMSDVVKQVDKITGSNLNTRVNEGNGQDEIAQLAITFNNMLERLESTFEIQKSFVSNAAHELRTPLTSITGQIEVSLMKSRSREEYEEILRSVLEDTVSLNELANGLLDMARANSDISRIVMHKLRIDDLLWKTRTELAGRKTDYNIFILYDEVIDNENKLTVTGNEHLLKICLLNLMDNACKYSENKSVEVILSFKDSKIVMSFKDTGIGIDTDDQGKIFQPFFRAKNAKNVPGNGLGLSLAARITHVHGGTITLQSIVGKGTKITVSIPSFS